MVEVEVSVAPAAWTSCGVAESPVTVRPTVVVWVAVVPVPVTVKV